MQNKLTKSFSMRLTEEESEELQRCSDEHGVSKNSICRFILFYQDTSKSKELKRVR